MAIISKKELKVSSSDFKDPLNQSRYISAEIKYKKKIFSLISIYLPNGNPVNTDKYEYKKKWMDLFEKFIKTVILKKKSKSS